MRAKGKRALESINGQPRDAPQERIARCAEKIKKALDEEGCVLGVECVLSQADGLRSILEHRPIIIAKP